MKNSYFDYIKAIRLMPSKNTREQQQERKTDLLAATSLQELCGLLRTDTRRLSLLLKDPKYKFFSVPK